MQIVKKTVENVDSEKKQQKMQIVKKNSRICRQ